MDEVSNNPLTVYIPNSMKLFPSIIILKKKLQGSKKSIINFMSIKNSETKGKQPHIILLLHTGENGARDQCVCKFYAIIISCIYLTVQLLIKLLTHFMPHVLELKCETHTYKMMIVVQIMETVMYYYTAWQS